MTDPALWQALYRWRSVAELAERTGVSRMTVWRKLQTLHQRGDVRIKVIPTGYKPRQLWRRDERAHRATREG